MYIKYVDHVLFKRTNHSGLNPNVREAVGWLVSETPEAIYIVFDRSVNLLPHEKPSDSGMVILKSDVLERRVVS
ncbi:MAG: hypothetical protein ACETV1_07020 [Candidatus Bathyarchaeia archaeon]